MEPKDRFSWKSAASELKKLDKKFTISLDNAFKDDNEAITINCSDIKQKPSSKPSLRKTRNEIKRKKSLTNVLDLFQQQWEQSRREYIAALCGESGRTQEWVETSLEYKSDHFKCEMCGETSNIEAHDILPYHQLTEGQRHNKNFLKQNLISLCHDHHQNVAHLGDPDWIKFDPRIREICEEYKATAFKGRARRAGNAEYRNN
jgi:hypothetical protein